jgi:hypothetical protein
LRDKKVGSLAKIRNPPAGIYIPSKVMAFVTSKTSPERVKLQRKSQVPILEISIHSF